MAETEWSTITPNKGDPQEKIEFEIEGEEEVVEAAAPEPEDKVEVVEETEQPEVEVEEVEQQATDEIVEEAKTEEEVPEEKGIETSGAQKRIRQLVSQKKEREAEIEKLLEQNKQMQLELQQQKKEYLDAVGTNLQSSEAQVNEKLAIARDSYKRAIDSGDSDIILQAQEYLNKAQQDIVRLAEAKRQYEAYVPQAQEEPVGQQPTGETYNGYGLKAYQWAASNDWFNQDQILTNAALVLDAQLKEEGFDPEEDDFYVEIDKRLAENFPQKFGNTQKVAAEKPRTKATSQPSQVVAGASHTAASPSNKKVKLSQEDVRLAQKWGITLEQYAAEKLKVESAGDGEYTTINR